MGELSVIEMSEDKLDECVDLFIDTFSKEPWNDIYESREQVVTFFKSHLHNNYFLGYIGLLNTQVVALSIGMKKPWINGMEYYIDEFCVAHHLQGHGIGREFLKQIEENIKPHHLNGIMLNTDAHFPSYDFYLKNGFKVLEELRILVK